MQKEITRIDVIGHTMKYMLVVPSELLSESVKADQKWIVDDLGAQAIYQLLSQSRKYKDCLSASKPQPLDPREEFPVVYLQNMSEKDDTPRLRFAKREIATVPTSIDSTPKKSDNPDRQTQSVVERSLLKTTNRSKNSDASVSLVFCDCAADDLDKIKPSLLPKSCKVAVIQIFASHRFAEPSEQDRLTEFFEVWKRKCDSRGIKVVLATSVSTLNQLGMSIHGHNSWGAFVDDCRILALDKLRPSVFSSLLRFSDLVVRGDSGAALRITEKGDATDEATKHEFRLHYLVAPDRLPTSGAGFLVGYTSFIAVSLACAFYKCDVSRQTNIEKSIENGINGGVWKCFQLDQFGVGHRTENVQQRGKYNPGWMSNLVEQSPTESDIATVHSLAVKDVESQGQKWSVLVQVIHDVAEEMTTRPNQTIGADLMKKAATKIALEIVMSGLGQVQRDYKLTVAHFGHLKVVDRREFEDYWEIKEAIRAYLSGSSNDKPISLAVFGAPGSGKSFGVTQIAKHLGMKKLYREPIEANVSQFGSQDDLAQVLHRVRDISLTGSVPLVFFDEFDGQLKGQAFGWLRSFLAPMQDAKFRDGKNTYNVGQAIFVFTGGVNRSFEMFNARMRDRDFVDAKGPDFVSRLRRHLNVLGLDPNDSDDVTYIVRRGILLRGMLEKYHRSIIKGGVAQMDRDVVRAFLTISEYKHGVRSMEAVVSTSRVDPPNFYFHKHSLPMFEQLNMHLSAREFMDLVRRPKS